ncbi:MAG: DUF3870 domain-containing protein [Negativicutes bacterium]|nr:DUF3870 domain-containing protein [Negativicutes bacterium]
MTGYIGVMGLVTENRYVMFSGYAKPPVDTCVSNKPVGVIVLIDTLTDVIVEADCTLVPEVSRQFVASLIQGQSIKLGPARIIDELVYVFQDLHCRAIIAALRIIYDKYTTYKKQESTFFPIYPA